MSTIQPVSCHWPSQTSASSMRFFPDFSSMVVFFATACHGHSRICVFIKEAMLSNRPQCNWTRDHSVCVCARPKLDSIHLNPLWCPQYDLVWVDLSSQSWRYSTSIPCDTRRVLDIAKTDFGGLEVLAECLRPWSPKGRIGSGCQIGYPWPPKIHQNPRFQKIWLYIGGKSTCYLEKSEGILCHETTSNPRLASLCYSPIDVLQFRYLHQHAQTSDDFCVLQRSHRLFLKIRIPSGNLT